MDGKRKVGPIKNYKPVSFKNAKVYLGDKYHNPAVAEIRNLNFNDCRR